MCNNSARRLHTLSYSDLDVHWNEGKANAQIIVCTAENDYIKVLEPTADKHIGFG